MRTVGSNPTLSAARKAFGNFGSFFVFLTWGLPGWAEKSALTFPKGKRSEPLPPHNKDNPHMLGIFFVTWAWDEAPLLTRKKACTSAWRTERCNKWIKNL